MPPRSTYLSAAAPASSRFGPQKILRQVRSHLPCSRIRARYAHRALNCCANRCVPKILSLFAHQLPSNIAIDFHCPYRAKPLRSICRFVNHSYLTYTILPASLIVSPRPKCTTPTVGWWLRPTIVSQSYSIKYEQNSITSRTALENMNSRVSLPSVPVSFVRTGCACGLPWLGRMQLSILPLYLPFRARPHLNLITPISSA